MDYIWKAIGIVFIVTVVIFIYNALKIQHGSGHFPNQKDDPPKVDQKDISDVGYERAKKDKWERDLKTWKNLGTY